MACFVNGNCTLLPLHVRCNLNEIDVEVFLDTLLIVDWELLVGIDGDEDGPNVSLFRDEEYKGEKYYSDDKMSL